ncbi:MAG TPA: tetratricopeptide repeat protein [Terriglobales bacterium]|nr:tetratricopeptide repeat protein [Terriglobales bacterium]
MIEQIGAGGMGVVFRAHDEQLRRDVAVKIIPPTLIPDERSREQFHREALAVGRLNHPNIAMGFDFGEENGIDYLVTEYIAGVTLDEKIDAQAMPQTAALKLGVQLLNGLAAAHREHVVHRDLKPSNIRINRDGQLKILDFGLAQFNDPVDESAETINLDTDLSVSGTLPYMAPELLRNEEADERTDIWAAGAVLYEMATGKRAFADKKPTILVDSILHYDPVKPSLLNQTITSSFEAVILRALDRDPEGRYQSAAEMCADLNSLVAGDEIATATLRRRDAAQLAAARRRQKLILGVVLVLLAGVAIGYFLKRALAPQQRILAVLPIDMVGQDQATNALGLGLMETLTAKLSQVSDTDSIQVVSSRDLRDQKVKTAEDARREFGSDLVIESSIQKERDTIRVNSFLVDTKTHRQLASRTITVDAGDSFGLQDRVVSEALDMLPVRIGPAQRQKLAVKQDTKPAAYEAYMRGRGYMLEFTKPEDLDNALAEFDQAVKIDPNYALGYAALGDAYAVGFQQYLRGNEWIDKALHYCQKSLSLNPDLVEGHICLGNVYNTIDKNDKAVEEFQRAVQTEPGNENAVRGLADAYTNAGNFAGAEAAYKQAVALRPNYWRVYSWLGNFYFGQNRYDDAAQAFVKATQLAPNSYLGFSNLAAMYLALGRYPEAIEALNQSNALHPTTDAYLNLGYVYTLMHQYPEAITALEQALKIDDRDWMIWGNLADALYWSPNRRGEAAANYNKAISIATAKLQVTPDDVQALGYLADYSAMVGDKNAAFNYLQRALTLAPRNGDTLFRAALVYNHFNDTEQALSYLNKAAQLGYSRSWIRDTPDFSNLRKNPHFPS